MSLPPILHSTVAQSTLRGLAVKIPWSHGRAKVGQADSVAITAYSTHAPANETRIKILSQAFAKDSDSLRLITLTFHKGPNLPPITPRIRILWLRYYNQIGSHLSIFYETKGARVWRAQHLNSLPCSGPVSRLQKTGTAIGKVSFQNSRQNLKGKNCSAQVS